MTMIRSISGFRGTIGGAGSDNLTPLVIVQSTVGFGAWILSQFVDGPNKPSVVIGRDARPSGEMVQNLVMGTLQAMGIDVIDLGLSTTPTVEMAVVGEGAQGGIVLTASHNPVEWNALKLLNQKGEFISAEDGAEVIRWAESEMNFAPVEELGQVRKVDDWIARHIDAILDLDLVDVQAISAANFKVVVDAVHSTGGISVPPLLKALGVSQVVELYCEPHGRFPHNPEPLPEHLTDLSEAVVKHGADAGFSVDPDVDRLAMICQDGSPFGEEYTLVSVADYVLQHTPGAVVSNLSSTRALRDVAGRHGVDCHTSAVGEVNVVNAMRACEAIIGGEGNGGVIYPTLHAGRDALLGIALWLSHLAHHKAAGGTARSMRDALPAYVISKDKLQLEPGMDPGALLDKFCADHAHLNPSTVDGVKLDLPEGWVHLRRSNTEPIVRIYAEAATLEEAKALGNAYKMRLMAGVV
ncbi:MAG: phosphoglucosamine mutase [Flavobacteriales bacterium]|nr:phosphoglucosamine mutase [Flavobacteriales bacterium]